MPGRCRSADRAVTFSATPSCSAGLPRRCSCGSPASASCWRPQRQSGAGGSRRAAAEAVCRRGLEIFILAFLFRLQAFLVSPGGHPVTLFRVDILNIMGPAIVAAGLVWAAGRRRRPVSCRRSTRRSRPRFAMAHARRPAIGGGRSRCRSGCSGISGRAGDHTTFTLFPGPDSSLPAPAAACCSWRPRSHAERRAHCAACLRAAILTVAGWASTRRHAVDLRAVVVLDQFADLFRDPRRVSDGGASRRCTASNVCAADSPAVHAPLERFGRRSLFVYWIHVELVYGYATWPLHRRLPLWGAVAACVDVFRADVCGGRGARPCGRGLAAAAGSNRYLYIME